MVWLNRLNDYSQSSRELKLHLFSASQVHTGVPDSSTYTMPSASPLYNFPNVLADSECPYRYPNSVDNVPVPGCPVPSGPFSGGCKLPTEYDPFKYLSAMTEQSLSANFSTHAQTSQPCSAETSNPHFLFSHSTHVPSGFQCHTSSASMTSSSHPQSYTSQSSAGCCMYTSGGGVHQLDGYTGSGRVSEAGYGPPHNIPRSGGLSGQDSAECKKSFLCSTEELMESSESENLLSWTRQHPEHWSCAEVLDWLYFVAQERSIDMEDFRGEAFQSLTGEQLCRMNIDDFGRLEPKYGILLYQMLKKLLSGVSFMKPSGNQHTSSDDCTELSPFSAVSCDSSRDSPGTMSFQSHVPYQLPRKACLNFPAPEGFWKQERPDWKPERADLQSDVIDLDSYDFDLTDPPNIPASALEQCPPEYEAYPNNFQTTTPMRNFCYYPVGAYPPQLPRRRPGRPRVKSLPEDDERSSKDKKVKNQHLWEFIYETLLNPLYNPQYLRWENQREGVFRFVQSEAVAQLWGSRKNNENMTYEKLSRAMRHYYKRGILERVEGRRLVYKFSRKAMDRVREKRHSSV